MRGMVEKKVKEKSQVDVEYEGRLDDGTVFDTNKEDVAKKAKIYHAERTYELLHVTLGEGYVIKGFEHALLGMKEGEVKDVANTPEDAYGFPRAELMKVIDKSVLQGREVKKGDVVLVTIQGQNVPATVMEVGDQVKLNFNHPLAGRTLHFKIKVVKIVKE